MTIFCSVNSMRAAAFISLLACVSGLSAHAYELATHGYMTYKAFKKSSLGGESATLLNSLGLDREILEWPNAQFGSKRPFGDIYIEMSSAGDFDWIANRRNDAGDEFDWVAMPIIGPIAQPEFFPRGDNLTIPGWLMRGSIREDDALGVKDEPNPHDDTPSATPATPRVFRHFFDPRYNTSFTVAGMGPFAKNPDWALGLNDSFAANPDRDMITENYFTVLKAREAMFRAVTLKARNNDGTFEDLSALDPAQRQELRKKYWATTFRSLGDVLHMLQDMAQPQHTRDELHSGVGNHEVQARITGHKSTVEWYTEAKVKRERSFIIKNYKGATQVVQIGTPQPPFSHVDYAAVPMFARYADYWSVNPGNADRSGKGLADYSNRGFFTSRRNLTNAKYALPNPSPSAYGTPVMMPVTNWDGSPIDTEGEVPMMKVYRGTVTDTLDSNKTETDVALSASSGWDELVTQYSPGTNPPYAIMQVNYDEQIRLLVPRAVSYSAGLLNYFFRGRLQIDLPTEKVYAVVDHTTTGTTGGFGKLKVKVTNKSPKPGGAANEIETMDVANGAFYAVAKFHRNTCYAADLSREYGSPNPGCRSSEEDIVVSAKASDVPTSINTAAGGDVEFSFPNPIPIGATDIFLQVVYRGPLGHELDAVVVETKDISEPTYFYIYSPREQYLYQHYPNFGAGPYTWAEWCLQSTTVDPTLHTRYPSVDACYTVKGRTFKIGPEPATWAQQAPSASPNVHDIALRPAFQPFISMTVKVGELARVGVLLDRVHTQSLLAIEESIDPYAPSHTFAWERIVPAGTINEGEGVDRNASVAYIQGRSVYLPSWEQSTLTGGNAPSIPPLILKASQINF